MTQWRWRASGVPASLAASRLPCSASAFMPAVTTTGGAAMAYKQYVELQPGTQGIAAPNNDIPQDRYAAGQKTSYAPPVWYPTLGYQHRLPPFLPAGGNDSPVRVWSDNQLPVPAADPTRGTRRFGGGHVAQPYTEITQPRVAGGWRGLRGMAGRRRSRGRR